ncbi:hypothetical protein Tco_0926022 [Tanacetum coccineum]|uniref:Uncharacterized protein n=1 Tax=Tanacetum coccineum TaxID=301880 RepID=A0ABQ5D9D6_9ASTR
MNHLSKLFHSLGRDEGGLSLNELTDLCTSLSKKVESLKSKLKQTKQAYNATLIKLIKMVKKLEQTIKTSQARRRAKVVIFDDKEVEEDSFLSMERKIEELDLDARISLVPPHAEYQGSAATALADASRRRRSVENVEKKVKTNKARRRARIVISEDEDAEEDSSKQGRKISEIDKDPTISLVQPEQDMEYDFDVSTAEGFTTASIHVTTTSVTPEVSTAAKNLVDAKIAKQLQEEFDKARQEQEVVAEADQAHDIDWSDPIVLRYHALQNRSFFVAEVRKNMCMYLKNQGGIKQSHFKGISYEDIRLIFEKVYDQNNAFVPKDSEIEKEVMKRPGFDFQQKSSKKRSKEDSDEDNAKKQKLEDDAEKEDLRDSMDVVPRYDIANGSLKNYKVFSEMLDDFDRQDVMDLYRLVQESTGVAIHMMIEKKYPLTQEILSRILNRRLEVDHESEMAYELLRFIRSQLQK